MHELDQFLASWEETAEGNRAAFIALQRHLAGMENTELRYVARPGISHSLRVRHRAQTRRELFAMVDVIEEVPRWLSVCLYQDWVSDPEGLGDSVLGGLLGEDAICFDVEQHSQKRLAYICQRLDEACRRAAEE